MDEYVFRVTIVAEVGVRAPNEDAARDIIVSGSALTSPSNDDIRLTNQASFITGKQAIMTNINFAIDESSIKLVDRREGPVET
jgi:hypothetical protein